MIGEFLIILLLILLNGLLSLSEIAIISAKKGRLEQKAKKGNPGAKMALDLANNPSRFLSTVQIGITLVGILTGFFSGASFATYIEEHLKVFATENTQFSNLTNYAHSISIVIVVTLITFIMLVFGELLPKRLGMSKPELFATFLSPLMKLIYKFTSPFIWLLSSTTDLFIKLFNIRADETKITEEEIRAMIDEGATAGTIEEIEQDIVERVFHLGDKRVGSLMTPGYDIIWLDINDSTAENLQKIADNRHSIYPVCDGELDKISGIVTVKDILGKHIAGHQIEIKDLITTVNFFPENMRAYIALEKFKETKIHQAIIIDEYGSTIGMVTINDLFDALVGDLSQGDEDSMAYELFQREDGSWLIDGQYPWDDFLKEFEVDDDTHIKEGFHTIGGFIMHILKDLPDTGEQVAWNQFNFEVVDMDGMRIDKIIVKKNDV